MIATLLLAMIPLDIPTDKVCELELNTFHDDQGEIVFQQLIGWSVHSTPPTRRVVFWRLWKRPEISPTKNRHSGLYELTWHDGDTLRRVQADAFYETWTQTDPELSNRYVWPKDRRRGLFTRRTEATPSGIDGGDLAP